MVIKKVSKKEVKLTEEQYIPAVGRRKKSVARVRIYKGTGFEINGKKLNSYFLDSELPGVAIAPLNLISGDAKNNFKVTVRVSGGGKRGQAEAIRLGLSRALQVYNREFRPILKKAGYLKRDSRMKERKKYGLKRARRAPQWAKR